MIAGIHCILRDRSRCDICRQRVVRCGRLVVSYNKLAASGGEINDLQFATVTVRLSSQTSFENCRLGLSYTAVTWSKTIVPALPAV